MSHANRYDLIRLALANCVFLYHLVSLNGNPSDGVLEYRLALLAEAAIQGFFIVSGALVYGSLERSKTLWDYFGKRVRRLYPAYLVVILCPALISLWVSGALLPVAKYLGANLLFLNFLAPDLPGLFEENRFTAVNGALWTLKIEVMFYAVLPILAWLLARAGRVWPILMLGFIGLSYAWWHYWVGLDTFLGDRLARQLPGQLMFFAAGMALWTLRDWCRANAILLSLVGAAVLASNFVIGGERLASVVGLACLIAGLAYAPGPKSNVTRWGDVSYGVYIVHFPIIQAMTASGLSVQLGQITTGLLTVMLVYALSYLLWWCVERPALRLDSHYRLAGRP